MIKLRIDEVLLRQHEMCLEFTLHQDRIAWQLISIYFAIQVGLISGIVILYTAGISQIITTVFLVLFVMGSLVSLIWFFILYRNQLWRDIWQLKGLQIENELKEMGIRLSIFKTFYDVLEHRYKLVKFHEEVRHGSLSLLEKLPTLTAITWSMLVIAAAWIVLYLIIQSLGIF